MAEVVYGLCSIAGLACAVLLARAFMRTPTTLLFWSSICFASLAVNSILVFVDTVIGPVYDLRAVRLAFALLGLIPLAVALTREK